MYLLKPSQINHHDEHLIDEPDVVLIELEPGDLVLDREEVDAIARELLNHHISYGHSKAREVVSKICGIAAQFSQGKRK